MVRLRGEVRTRSEVFAKNQNSLEIVGKETGPSGKYDLVMRGEVNDRIIVWYTDDGEQSEFVEVWVPDTDPPGDGLGGASDE